MGRIGNNATQQETIDDAFPPPGGIEDNDSNIPPSHQTPPLIQPRSKVPPSKSKPPRHEPEEEDLYYPNSHHHDETPESFPPKNHGHDHDHDHDHDQGSAHAFPPNNFYDYNHQHQAQPFPPTNNVGIGTNVQFQQHHQHQPQVPIGQPAIAFNTTGAVVQNQNRPWNSSLFDCMNDPQNALITACFPCVTFGQIAEIVDSGNTSCGTSGMLYGLIACCIAVPCIMSCTYRTKMRGRFGLIESPAPDWVVHCFCECCALCQEYRQLKDMNLDPSIGWQGNVAMQRANQQFTMTPPMGQRMM